MDNYNLRIKHLINTSCELLFANENIIGFGRRRKRINGYNSNLPSITVLVKKKLPKGMLNPYELIPKKFYGAVTDVGESGNVNYHTTEKVRPLVGGIKIRLNNTDFAGTLGYFVTDRATKGKLYLLSNSHVLFNPEAPEITDVLQPPYSEGGTLATAKIATVKKLIIPQSRILHNYQVINEVDAAIAYIGPNTEQTQKNLLSLLL